MAHNIVYREKNDPNYSFDVFDLTIHKIMDKYFPWIKVTNKKFKQQFKPRITMGIHKSIKRRDRILQKFINTKDESKKEEFHDRYKFHRNMIVSLIMLSKKNHYEDNFKNIRKTWGDIKSIINIRNLAKSQPSSLLIGKEISSNPKIIANTLNKYFSSIAGALQGQIHHRGNDFTKYLSRPNDYNFFINRTDEYEIINIINNLSSNKATGPHSIPTDILQLIKFNISKPLSAIFNLSFSTSIYPDKLKIAKVMPVFKDKGSPLQCMNYRSNSLQSNINKIYEKLMYSRLYNFLNLHNCIYDLQFGFREKHTTNHALLSLAEIIRDALDNNNFACGIFIDLQKAFDTVDHSMLLNKLNHYGIRG